MTLCEELYFEITLSGTKPDLKKFISFLRSGGLEDFFEFESEYILYDDSFETATPSEETSISLSNEDFGIEIEELDVDEFLDIFCRASKDLSVSGRLFDIDNEEFCFESDKGDSYYVNMRKIASFNEDEFTPKDEDEDDDYQ